MMDPNLSLWLVLGLGSYSSFVLFRLSSDAKNLVFLPLEPAQAKKVIFGCQVNKRGTPSLFGVFVNAPGLRNLTSVAPTASNSLRPRLRV